jgi:hypothetical protein
VEKNLNHSAARGQGNSAPELVGHIRLPDILDTSGLMKEIGM